MNTISIAAASICAGAPLGLSGIGHCHGWFREEASELDDEKRRSLTFEWMKKGIPLSLLRDAFIARPVRAPRFNNIAAVRAATCGKPAPNEPSTKEECDATPRGLDELRVRFEAKAKAHEARKAVLAATISAQPRPPLAGAVSDGKAWEARKAELVERIMSERMEQFLLKQKVEKRLSQAAPGGGADEVLRLRTDLAACQTELAEVRQQYAPIAALPSITADRLAFSQKLQQQAMQAAMDNRAAVERFSNSNPGTPTAAAILPRSPSHELKRPPIQ